MDFRDAPHSAPAFGPPPRRPADRPSRPPSPAWLLSRRHLQSAPRPLQALRRRPRAAIVRRPGAAPPQGRSGLDPGPLPARRPPHAPARPPERKPRPPRRPSPPPVGAKPPLGRGGSMPPRAPTRPAPGAARRGRPAPAPCARASRGSETSPASPSRCRLLSARSRRSAEGARCPRGRQLRAGGGAWAVDILAARAFSRGRALRPSPPVPPPIPDAAPR